MIQRGSKDWQWLLRNLQKSKRKSNRDIFCTECWEIYKYEENIKHKAEHPDHIRHILTSKVYATESKFIKIAREK